MSIFYLYNRIFSLTIIFNSTMIFSENEKHNRKKHEKTISLEKTLYTHRAPRGDIDYRDPVESAAAGAEHRAGAGQSDKL